MKGKGLRTYRVPQRTERFMPFGPDVVRARQVRSDVEAAMKLGRPPRRQRRHPQGKTVTVSYTITREMDQLVCDLAHKLAMTRSAVIRQAIALFAHRHAKELL